MKSNIVFEGARLFGIKPLGQGCRFGIKINSKQQDGSYSKGVFLNGKHNQMLSEGQNYTLSGFLTTNIWQNNETLEFIAMTAVAEGIPMPKVQRQPVAKPVVDADEEIPF